MKTVTLKQYTADAFTDRVFSGNPAAVCVLPAWPADPVMQAIAKENNLSETAFTVRADGGWALRWFTPGGEIDLCGHATLGTAFVLMHFYEKDAERIAFSTRSGALTVERRDSLYEMDFPAYDLAPVPVTDDMAAALGARPDAAYMGRDLLCVFGSADTVRALSPDMEALKDLPGLLAHATAPSDARTMTACPAPSRRSSPSRKTRCAAPATATSSPTGAAVSAKKRSPHTRHPPGAACSTAARKARA